MSQISLTGININGKAFVLPKTTTFFLYFLLLLSSSHSSISGDIFKGKMFVLCKQILMLNDFVLSAESCPVLTAVRAEYCKIFLS